MNLVTVPSAILTVVTLVILQCGTARADDGARNESSIAQDLLGGLVANQTMTLGGQDFYQHFASLWRDKEMSSRYSLSIFERPSPRTGSQIWVEYRQRRVFQAFLPPARANVKAISEQAVEIAYQTAMEAEVQQALFQDRDIGPDEM